MGPIKDLLIFVEVESFPADRANLALVKELPCGRAIEDLEYEHAEDRLAYSVFVVLAFVCGMRMATNNVANLVLGDTVELTKDVRELMAPENLVVRPFVCRTSFDAGEVDLMASDDPAVQLVENRRDFEFCVPNYDMFGPGRSFCRA